MINAINLKRQITKGCAVRVQKHFNPSGQEEWGIVDSLIRTPDAEGKLVPAAYIDEGLHDVYAWPICKLELLSHVVASVGTMAGCFGVGADTQEALHNLEKEVQNMGAKFGGAQVRFYRVPRPLDHEYELYEGVPQVDGTILIDTFPYSQEG